MDKGKRQVFESAVDRLADAVPDGHLLAMGSGGLDLLDEAADLLKAKDSDWNAALDAALAVMLDEEKMLAREAVSATGVTKARLLAMGAAVYNAGDRVEGLRKKP